MKIVVALDGDGHFTAAPIEERKKVVESVLMKIHDGDYFRDINDVDDYMSLNDEEWLNYLGNFTQRGTCNILTI